MAKLTWFQRLVLKRTRPTLKAIAFTGNQWRAADRLFFDGGSESQVWLARRAGFIEPTGRKGFVLIGAPHDMVKLTDLGVSLVNGGHTNDRP